MDAVVFGVSRFMVVGACVVGCSKPPEPASTTGPTPSPTATAASPHVAAASAALAPGALDPATLTFVDIPARKPPKGVRLMIGVAASSTNALLSPAGDVLALADGPTGFQLLHVPTGRGLAVRSDLTCIEPEARYVGPCEARIAFARDGKRVAFWRPLTKKLVVLEVPAGKTAFEKTIEDVSSITFLDDGRLIVGLVGTAKRLDAYDASGTARPFLAVDDYVRDVHHDGSQVATDDNTLRLVDVASGKDAGEPPPGVELSEVAWAADGTRVATTAGEWSDVVTWRRGDRSVRTLASSAEARKVAGGDGVRGFAVPAPYDRLYVGLGSGLVGMTVDGKRTFESKWLTSMGLGTGTIAPRSDGGVVLRIGECALQIDAKGLPVTTPLGCPLRPAMVAIDGDRVHSIPWLGGIAMTFDAKTGALLASRLLDAAHPGDRNALTAYMRDPALSAKIEAAFKLPNVKPGWFQLSRDGRWLLIGAESGREYSIIDLRTNKARTGLRMFMASGDGTRIAQYREDTTGIVDVRSVDDDRLIRSLTLPPEASMRQALSDDGKLFAVDVDGKIHVIDVASGKTAFVAPCSTTYAGNLAFSRDGSRLACDDGTSAVVFDIRTKKLLKSIPHPDAERVDEVALSDDGRRLAISDGDLFIVDL